VGNPAAPPHNQENGMNSKKILECLDRFHSDMTKMIVGAGIVALPDNKLNQVLKILREKGIWGESNDVTLERMSESSSRSEAFANLTAGNPVIKSLIEEQMRGSK
jgi:hypothetical protein